MDTILLEIADAELSFRKTKDIKEKERLRQLIDSLNDELEEFCYVESKKNRITKFRNIENY